MRMRPGRSVTSILPSGRNASAHGLTSRLRRSAPRAGPPTMRIRCLRRACRSRSAASPSTGSPPSAPRSQVRQVFSSCPDRDVVHRALPRKVANEGARRIIRDYNAGIGIAMVTLIESTVRVTIRHSDSAPIASEAATALVNREEATGAGRLDKARSVRTTVSWSKSFKVRANHPRRQASLARPAGNIAAAGRPESGKIAARTDGMPLFLAFQHFRAQIYPARSLRIRFARRKRVNEAVPPLSSGACCASSTSAPGCQSMATKPGVCSTRRSQARIAGKVARS